MSVLGRPLATRHGIYDIIVLPGQFSTLSIAVLDGSAKPEGVDRAWSNNIAPGA
jgi:hypothetical protein